MCDNKLQVFVGHKRDWNCHNSQESNKIVCLRKRKDIVSALIFGNIGDKN
jgi:hypothetical protein